MQHKIMSRQDQPELGGSCLLRAGPIPAGGAIPSGDSLVLSPFWSFAGGQWASELQFQGVMGQCEDTVKHPLEVLRRSGHCTAFLEKPGDVPGAFCSQQTNA